jgi:hypothetical protein
MQLDHFLGRAEYDNGNIRPKLERIEDCQIRQPKEEVLTVEDKSDTMLLGS